MHRGEDEPDQYWVGRALRVEKVYTEPGSVAGTAGRVRYDVGDCEIAVHWFQRDVSGGSERRTFKLWATERRGGAADAGPVDGETYTFNSTELRLINTPSASAGAIQLEMRPLPGVGAVPLNIVHSEHLHGWHG